MSAGWHRVVCLCVLWGLTASAWAGTPLPDGPHIVVSGEGKATGVPDQVRVTFEFTSRGAKPLPTKQAVDAGVNRLLGRLGEFDIAKDDIRAGDLSTREDIDYTDSGKLVSNGFTSERSVTVLLKQVDRLNDLIDMGLGEGASEFSGPNFESSQATALRAQAKREAIDNLRAKAVETAASFNAQLGPVYSINSVNSQQSRVYNEAYSLDAVTVSGSRQRQGRYLQPSVEYTESVNAVFELKR